MRNKCLFVLEETKDYTCTGNISVILFIYMFSSSNISKKKVVLVKRSAFTIRIYHILEQEKSSCFPRRVFASSV
jgi:hypothetical protein